MIKKHEHPAAEPDERLFGNLLRSKRMARRIGLVELAQRSGIDAGLLSRFEHGKRRAPESPHLIAIANGLGVPLESDEFAELLAAANHDRHPTEYEMVMQILGGQPWDNPLPCPGPSACSSQAAAAYRPR